MQSRKFRHILLALSACTISALSSPARADIFYSELSFSFSKNHTLNGPGPTQIEDFKTKDFQQFSPLFGTLTGARWELESAWGALGAVTVHSQRTDPDAPVTGSVQMGVGMDTRVNYADSQALVGTNGQYFSDMKSVEGSCTTTMAQGPCGFELQMSNAFNGVIEATDLAAFIGNGVFTQGVEFAFWFANSLNGLSDDEASISSIGLFSWGDGFGGVGKLRLVYEFDPIVPPGEVPEPSSLVLALAGLGLVAANRRKMLVRRA